MVKPTPVFRVQGSVDKAELAATTEFHGAANLNEFHGYAPGGLRFAAFAGVWDRKARRFTGEFLFYINAGNPDDPKRDFTTIPGIAATEPAGKGKK